MATSKQNPPAVPAGEQPGSDVSPPASKKKPVQEIRLSTVKAVIGANDTEAGTRHNVTLRRIFKRDSNAQGEQSDPYGRDSLPLAIEVLHPAWLRVHAQHA